MSELVFEGFITKGIGRHSELGVPGRSALPTAPADWPEVLCPGSLNVRIHKYPEAFDDRGIKRATTALDAAQFIPEFEIPREMLANNRLGPKPRVPRGGDAQVWRAVLEVIETGEKLNCWVLRRFGSGLADQLELVSEEKLRDRGIQDRQRVNVVLQGRWHDA